MSKTLRIRKDGSRVYEIRCFRGRDPITGKQLTPYTMTWQVPDSYSKKVAEREAAKIEGEFIARCKAGEVLTKQEEIQKRKEQAEQEEKDRLEHRSKPTFSEYAEYYLNNLRKANYAAGTLVAYKQVLDDIGKRLGTLKIEEITKDMMRQYYVDLQDKKEYKYRTQNRYFAVAVGMFNAAVEDSTISTSPMLELKKPRRSKNEKGEDDMKMKSFDEKQVAYIMECLDKEELRWKVMVMYMLDTGCRRGEVAGVKWEHIDLKTGELTVCNNRQYTPGKGCYDTAPKTGMNRTIFLTAPMLEMLKAWKKELLLFCMREGVPRCDYVFPSINGKGMNPSIISHYFQRFAKKYNLPQFHPHSLRHTMATISIANGADVVSVSKKLGHTTPSITLDVYSHANEEAQRRANEVLANAIYNKQESKQA